jgi:glyoxylase-like metal-dependent hydrolase (beta-lactamase superfamily II)
MQLRIIDAGRFKLDGGAMFGVVPKVLWQKLNPPDENNLCTWALRCLLIDTGEKRILIDTGMGTKQDDRFMSHFHPHGDSDLLSGLARVGQGPEGITDVFLTHLHFDHCGGALMRDDQGKIVPTFSNARYWTHKSHLDWALDPNPRERASFLKENIVPLIEHDVVSYIDDENAADWMGFVDISFVYGHTEAMMIPKIRIGDKTVVFCADLLPSSFHVRMPYVMGYDVRPLETLKEKKAFFEEAIENDYILFLEHDPVTECITLKKNEKGRFAVKEYLSLKEALL